MLRLKLQAGSAWKDLNISAFAAQRWHEETRRCSSCSGDGPGNLFFDEPSAGLDPIIAQASTN